MIRFGSLSLKGRRLEGPGDLGRPQGTQPQFSIKFRSGHPGRAQAAPRPSQAPKLNPRPVASRQAQPHVFTVFQAPQAAPKLRPSPGHAQIRPGSAYAQAQPACRPRPSPGQARAEAQATAKPKPCTGPARTDAHVAQRPRACPSSAPAQATPRPSLRLRTRCPSHGS